MFPRDSPGPPLTRTCALLSVCTKLIVHFSLSYSSLSGWPLYILLQPRASGLGEEVSDMSYSCVCGSTLLGALLQMCAWPASSQTHVPWQPYQCSPQPIPQSLPLYPPGSSLCLLKLWHVFLSYLSHKTSDSSERDSCIPTAKDSICYVTGISEAFAESLDGRMDSQSSFSFFCPWSHYQLGIPYPKCLRACVPDIFRRWDAFIPIMRTLGIRPKSKHTHKNNFCFTSASTQPEGKCLFLLFLR